MSKQKHKLFLLMGPNNMTLIKHKHKQQTFETDSAKTQNSSSLQNFLCTHTQRLSGEWTGKYSLSDFFFLSRRICTWWLTNHDAMGCGLRKIKAPSEENSPGKIYSTLKRPQVETKVGVAYTYRYLDFLIGKDGKTCFWYGANMQLYRYLTDWLQNQYVPIILILSVGTYCQHTNLFALWVHHCSFSCTYASFKHLLVAFP